MTYIVIGLGSMGKRRIRLFQKYRKDLNLVGIDSSRNRCVSVGKEYEILTYQSLEKCMAEQKITAILVCTSPLTHGEIILKCLQEKLHVFTEINLINENYEELIKAAVENKVELFISSTMLYRKEIDYIKEIVQSSLKKVCYRYHVGQYLPDWHPWESYKDFFVGDKRTNGCREIFAIEMPWIIKTFGKIKNLNVVKNKLSTLDIDYNDTYIVNIEHERGHQGVFVVDVVCRKAVRNLEVFSEDIQIRWDGTLGEVNVLDIEKQEFDTISMCNYFEDEKYNSNNILDLSYFEEMKVFVEKINGINNERYTFQDDKYTLSVIDEIEGT